MTLSVSPVRTVRDRSAAGEPCNILSSASKLAVEVYNDARGLRRGQHGVRRQGDSDRGDVAEMVRHTYLEEAEIGDIDIGTDTIETDEGGERNLSSIQIDLEK